MGKCYRCNQDTKNTIYNGDYEEVFMCERCADRYEFCDNCNLLFPGEDLAEYGICEECYEKVKL